MKKNVIIGILVLVTLISLAYGFVQNAAAVMAQKQAEENYADAIKQKALADKNAEEAKLQAQRADVEAESARRCEAECAKKK